jgi:hypothetical protein
MNLNTLILSTLSPTNVPVAFQVYTGTATTYITFFEYNQQGKLFADDTEKSTQHSIQVDVWSTGNYSVLVEQVRSLMIGQKFIRNSETEFYENDTKVFHKVFRFYYAK